MKQCEYCAREIDYSKQYCCDECEKNAKIFFNKEKRSEKIVSAVNCIAFLGIMVSVIIAIAFMPKLGALCCAAFLFIIGIIFAIFPFAPESITKKYKIKKAVVLMRIFALLFVIASVILLLVGLFVL